MPAPSVLLAEDDVELSALVSGRLSGAGFDVRSVTTGTAAIQEVARRTPDVLLLDVMLPEMDGLEVARRLRAEHPLLYIIMLTARADEIDRVVGLEVGADDYVTKPFSLQELVARVRAAVRRMRLQEEQSTSGSDGEAPVAFAGLEIHPLRREVLKGSAVVHLTAREFDLLYFLATHAGRPFTRVQLLDKVWNIQYEGYDRTVDSHIQRLRAKIEDDAANPRYVRTVWGVGYKFEPPAEE